MNMVRLSIFGGFSYDKSIRNLGQETMAEIEEIILDTDNSGHDCTLEKL